ncbi:MAG: sigma-54 dependent transcriptional regulator [Polyangiaceae bacterium]
MSKPRVLVIDDKASMVGLVVRVLEDIAMVIAAGSVREALDILERESVSAIVCDLRLPDGSGLDVLRATRTIHPAPPFVLMTAYASVETAVQAIRDGAYEYVTKPFDPDELRALVEGALARSRQNRDSLEIEAEGLGPLLGSSPKIREVFSLLRRVAPQNTTVLVLGETGTGKELVARALHELSPRAKRPFFAINCAAIPRDLLESELFGHVRGSFTGAQSDRPGLFESATGSTLLLDEIGDMRMSLQAKLTRVLENRAVRRVGDSRERPVDVRIVAATHRNLREMIREGHFREDLWFRLNVCLLELPPLRERRDDIALLAAHFLAERGPAVGASATSFSREAIDRLSAYDWPGNVRELRSVIERAALIETSEEITSASLPVEIRSDGSPVSLTDEYLGGLSLRDAQDLARDEMNRRYLTVLLRKHGGDVGIVAQRAGIERESVYRLLRRYGLAAGPFRDTVERPPPSRRRRDEPGTGGSDE